MPDPGRPAFCRACRRAYPCPASASDTHRRLHMLKDALARRDVQATGPHMGPVSPGWDYLRLPDGRRVHVRVDANGCWQALVYDGGDLVRMADTDGKGWPGDPV